MHIKFPSFSTFITSITYADQTVDTRQVASFALHIEPLYCVHGHSNSFYFGSKNIGFEDSQEQILTAQGKGRTGQALRELEGSGKRGIQIRNGGQRSKNSFFVKTHVLHVFLGEESLSKQNACYVKEHICCELFCTVFVSLTENERREDWGKTWNMCGVMLYWEKNLIAATSHEVCLKVSKYSFQYRYW